MLLVLAATEFEMMSYKTSVPGRDEQIMTAICGVGSVNSAVQTMRILGNHREKIRYVLNFGIGGAYLEETADPGIGLLDICLAESEVLGDHGVCFGIEVEPFEDRTLAGKTEFRLNRELITCARQEFSDKNLSYFSGPFVTLSSASGNAERGNFFKKKYKAICENMEGAAIASCCEMYSLPMVEVRVVSNMVEDRPGAPWKLKEACSRSGYVAALIAERIKELL